MGNKLVYVLLQLGRGCDVEEEVALGVGAAEVGREEGGEAAVGGCVGEAELDLDLHGDGAA